MVMQNLFLAEARGLSKEEWQTRVKKNWSTPGQHAESSH